MTDPIVTPENQKKNIPFFKTLIPVALILVSVLVGLSLLKRQHSHREMGSPDVGILDIREGAVLPDLDLHTVDHQSVKISSLQGKVFLLNFWATWCGPCIEEMPSIMRLQQSFKDQGFRVIGMNVDENPEEVLTSFQKKMNMDFISYIDPDGMLSDRFDVHGIPFTVVFDSHRKILAIETGDRQWDSADVKDKVKGWLGI